MQNVIKYNSCRSHLLKPHTHIIFFICHFTFIILHFPNNPSTSPTMNRRQMIRTSVMATSALAFSQFPTRAFGADHTAPVEQSRGLTAYQKDRRILVRYENLPVLSYRTGPDLKYPYFYPLAGPRSGLSLTTESSQPYPHHRGLWMGCDPLNGGNYWADNGPKSGQIRTTELILNKTEAGSNTVSFTQKCKWVREGSHPFNDERHYTITRPNDDLVFLDCAFKLTAMEAISIKKAKHSFFALRAASDISPAYGGTLFNSEGGIGAEATIGKAADWCGYYGKRRLNPDITEGIVIMNHPENWGGKCPWLTRDYGHLSPSPLYFRKKITKFTKGESFKLNYRVVLFNGTAEEANLSEIFKSWIG